MQERYGTMPDDPRQRHMSEGGNGSQGRWSASDENHWQDPDMGRWQDEGYGQWFDQYGQGFGHYGQGVGYTYGPPGYGQYGQGFGQPYGPPGYGQYGQYAAGPWSQPWAGPQRFGGQDFGRRWRSPQEYGSFARGGYGQAPYPYTEQGSGQGFGWQAGDGRRHGGTQSQLPSGGFEGRGPRGYRRSDERVREDVCDQLERHGWIDASGMDVQVRDGIVTLAGSVPDRSTKRMAEDLVGDCPGVRDVRNELGVGGTGTSSSESKSSTRANSAVGASTTPTAASPR